MTPAEQYLQSRQGILFFLRKKRSHVCSLNELNQLHPDVFAQLFQDYQDNLEELLIDRNIGEVRSFNLFKRLEKHYDAQRHPFLNDIKESIPDPIDLEQVYAELIPPSVFQDKGTYFLITQIAKRIQKAISTYPIRQPESVILGTLYTDQFNACAIHLPTSGEHLILFESHLFFFLNRLTKILVSCMVLHGLQEKHFKFSIEPDEMISFVNANPDIQSDFNTLVHAFITGADITTLPILVMPVHLQSIHPIILGAMEDFIMGHEYGHVLKKHATQENNRQKHISESPYSNYHPNWEQEFEADQIGLNLSVISQFQQGFGKDFSLVGAHLFFTISELIENARNAKAKNTIKDIHTHPPSYLRKQKLIEHLRKQFSEKEIMDALYLPEALSELIAHLWIDCKMAL